MPNWTTIPSAPQHIDILLFESFSALCLANTVEPLRAANKLSGKRLYYWRFLSLDGKSLKSSSDMQVSAQARLTDCQGDMLVVMPSYDFLRHANPVTTRALRAAAARYRVMAGFDTGSWLLARAGLLDGHRATIHWQELQGFAETFPDLHSERSRFVRDGNRITCSGAQASFDLMLDLIGQSHGQALRLEVAALLMGSEMSSNPVPQVRRTHRTADALSLMQANLEHPLTIRALARQLGYGQKALEQRMRSDLGTTPQSVYRRLRLIEAKRLVIETNMGVMEIALRCGYRDPSALTRAFRSEFGTTPRDLRASLSGPA